MMGISAIFFKEAVVEYMVVVSILPEPKPLESSPFSWMGPGSLKEEISIKRLFLTDWPSSSTEQIW